MKRFISVLSVLCLMTTQGFAASCYTPAQYKAEQAIRFHTNLMVFGLYCKAVMKQDTYGPYQSFTARNQNVIRKQENVLIATYKQTAFHSLRTNLANKTSLQASKSIITFCRQYTSDFQREKTMKPADFERYIDQIDVNQAKPSTRPLCSATKRGK